MRFPSIATLVEHAAAVFRRFPWTLLAGVVAAAAGIVASTAHANDGWTRLTCVAALGLPLTLALALLGEARHWGQGAGRSCSWAVSPAWSSSSSGGAASRCSTRRSAISN